MTEDLSVFTKNVLAQTDIVQVIQQYLSLRKTGSNHQGICPFHTEKTPSFSVNSNKQFFYCFGCHASGDAINFIMRYDNTTFIEALEKLALPLGLSVPKLDKNQKKIDTSIFKHMRNMTLACKSDLATHTDALQYLQQRSVAKSSIKKFHLGYCGLQYQKWFDEHKSFHNPLFLTFGLASQYDRRPIRPQFFKRLMFPIQDSTGKVIAFGARSLDGAMPKYINSPESDVFKKKHTLYGLYQFKALKQHHVFVVEGYMDVVSLDSHGIANSVACLGTAFTSSHWNLLKRHASKITFCFDGDQAGCHAAWKSLESILPQMDPSIKAYFLFLPEQEDPDSFIKKNGKQAFLALNDQALPWIDFLIQTLTKQHELSSLDGKAAFLQSGRALIDKLSNPALQTILTHEIESILKMPIHHKKTNIPITEKPSMPLDDKKIDAHATALLALLAQKDKSTLPFLLPLDNISHNPQIHIINIWSQHLETHPNLTGAELLALCQGQDDYPICLRAIANQTQTYSPEQAKLSFLSLKIEIIDLMIQKCLRMSSQQSNESDNQWLQSMILKKKSIEKERHELQTAHYS